MRFVWYGLAIALAATATASMVAGSLTINGKTTAADIRTIDGSAYVRLADVAKALDMSLVKKGAGFELVKAGGANQVGGLTGKIGDTLFDGKWRFTVVSVDTPESYQMKTDAEPYDYAGRTSMDIKTRLIKPSKGYSLVVIQCRLANGVKERRTLWTAISDKRINTAIADTSGSSHPPVAYDFKGGPTQTEWLLPGAQMTFAVVFSLPEGATPGDLVFTLKNNQTEDKPVDVRVSLAK
jgi:hypothetical protein